MLDLAFIRSHPDIIHQFNEVEQCVISKADHEDSVRWHEQLIRNTEELVQALELPNRVVNVCTGDIGTVAELCLIAAVTGAIGLIRFVALRSWVFSPAD